MRKGRSPTISLCLIAKNEEHWIAQCINSVRPLVAEIILVDTGSTDGTVKIAQKFGAKVYERPWDDDFSAPRNMSLAQASSDWILVLDADEAIDSREHARLRQLTFEPRNAYLLTQRHYTNDARASGFVPAKQEFLQWEQDFGGYFETSCVRFFPNHQGIEYRYRIHELVEPSILEKKHLSLVDSGIRIHHYGHTRSASQRGEKRFLYSTLGERKLVEQPRDWKGYYELGVEEQANGRFEASIEAFLKSIELNGGQPLSWMNLGHALGQLGKFEEAEKALLTALELKPKACEVHCNLGVVYLRTRRYEQAVVCFLAAIGLNHEYVNAHCNLGEALHLMGKYDEACQVFRKALKLFPRCAKAKEGLGLSCLCLGRVEEAEKLFLEGLQDDPTLARPHYWLSHIYRLTDRVQKAIESLEKFYETESRSESGVDQGALEAGRRECEMLKRLI